MMGLTHAVAGAAAGLAVGVAFHQSPEMTGLMTVTGAFGGLIPDIDHPKGTIRQKLGVVGHVGLFWLSHRGITHTALAMMLVLVGVWINPHPVVIALAAGYASHLLGDMLTVRGIPLLWPVSHKSFGFPPGIHSGGLVEGLLIMPGLLVVIVYLVSRMFL